MLMNPRRRLGRLGLALGLVLVLVMSSTSMAQLFGRGLGGTVLSPPSILSVMPPGATVGTEVEWVVTGRNLESVVNWVISGEGLEIEPVGPPQAEKAVLKVRVSEGAATGFRELRAIGGDGLSNLALIRVDVLPQVVEVEPNNTIEEAQCIEAGVAVIGTLTPQDLDHFRLEGVRGHRITVEVEAQRLGTPCVPVLAVLGPNGQSMARAVESRGVDHDARLAFTFPDDGHYFLQVRENLYGGAQAAGYRLRVSQDEPFSTAVFPLGGPAGQSVDFEVSGGNLPQPLSIPVALPEPAGMLFDPGWVDTPAGPIALPFRLAVGETTEVRKEPGEQSTPLKPGETGNGRIVRSGQVDRWELDLQKGESLGLRIRAAELGSWLDSVIRVLGPDGEVLAENDDAGINNDTFQYQPFNTNQSPANPDSRLSFTARADGRHLIEVFDRYGEGGPEYAYRLETNSGRPDFALRLLFGDPNLARRQARVGRAGAVPRVPGANGSLNLPPGGTAALQFLLTGDGGVGQVVVEAEGLPEGVTAEPVRISPPPFATANRPMPPSGGAIILKVAPDAPAGLGSIRIVGRAEPAGGPPIVRRASATILLEGPDISTNGVPSVPIGREVTEIAAWVVGDMRPATLRPDFIGPPQPVAATLREIANPGEVLRGGFTDLELWVDPPGTPAAGFELEVVTEQPGLALQTIAREAPIAPNTPSATVRVVADLDAPEGEARVRIDFRSLGGELHERIETVAVRSPFQLRLDPEAPRAVLGADGSATIVVEVERHPGLKSDQPIRLEALLPAGLRVAGPRSLDVPADRSRVEIRLERVEDEGPLDLTKPIVVTGTIRMPRGRVRVEMEDRPMLEVEPADK